MCEKMHFLHSSSVSEPFVFAVFWETCWLPDLIRFMFIVLFLI